MNTPKGSAGTDGQLPNNLEAFWMPFTANRQFKAKPRLLTSAAGMYYTSHDGRSILDGTAGLWCCNLGHAREEITEAVARQLATLDFAPTFQMGHPLPFRLAAALAERPPWDARGDYTPSGCDVLLRTHADVPGMKR
jgi:beta-alanine--pyruvate transaminase